MFMKKSKISVVLFLMNFILIYGQGEPPEYIFDLAEKENLEVVYGNKFPYINPYGCSGSPIVKGVLFDKDISKGKYISSEFVVFLTRKRTDENDSPDKIITLINDFEYYLIFARKNKNIYHIVKVQDSLLGGLNYYWDSSIDLDLSKFEYLSNPDLNGPIGLSTKDLVNKLIIMSCDSSIQFFAYYNGEWLTYIKRDW